MQNHSNVQIDLESIGRYARLAPEKPELFPLTESERERLKTIYAGTVKSTGIGKYLFAIGILALPVWNLYINWSLSDGAMPDKDQIIILIVGILFAFFVYKVAALEGHRAKSIMSADIKAVYSGGTLLTRHYNKKSYITSPADGGGGAIDFKNGALVFEVFNPVIDKDVNYGDAVILEMAINRRAKDLFTSCVALPLRVRKDDRDR